MLPANRKHTVGKLDRELLKWWKNYLGKREEFDKEVKRRIYEVEKELAKLGADVDKEHVRFWDTVYKSLNLDPESRYGITPEGEVYEVLDPNPFKEAAKSFIEAELPVEMPDSQARKKLLEEWEEDADRVEEVIKIRRQLFGDSIRQEEVN